MYSGKKRENKLSLTGVCRSVGYKLCQVFIEIEQVYFVARFILRSI